MHVAIVGAAFSGLVTASTLLAFGHSVVVYDARPNVGGVWSRERRYPGIRTQNSRDTYALSTMRMPASYPLHPRGEQVQAYLEQYAQLHGLDRGGGG
jgi:dimethylaniline monooxygenase (N-oxide forming)